MLYKLGMLGIIPTSLNREGYVTQEFLDSTKVTYITGNDLLNVNLDLEVLMCENSKLQAELEEIQDEFVETMGEFIRLKQEWEGC